MAPEKKSSTQNLATIADVAMRLDCSQRTVRRLISSGDLVGFRLGKRMVRVDLDQVDDLLRQIPTVGSAEC